MSKIIELSTEDKLEYYFFPVSNGFVQFKVRAANDAHIALTTRAQESDPMIEIFLGGWGNTKSVIKKNKLEKVETETSNILSDGELRDFWVRWDSGTISVGRENGSEHFLSWTDPEPFPIAFFGVCTGWGATGTWKIADGAEFNTPDQLEYKFEPVLSGSLTFEFRGPHNCHVALTPAPAEVNPMYEILLGGWKNTKSVIRHCKQKPDKVEVPTPGIMNPNEFRKFLIQWRCGRVIVRDGETGMLIMEWVDPTPFGVTHFGVRTSYGARGQWRITHFKNPGAQPR